MTKFWRKAFLLLSGACWCAMLFAAENINERHEYQLKTAYLFHFAELTEWPEMKVTSICVEGDSPLRHYLPALVGQKVNGMDIRVLQTDKQPIGECRILVLTNLATLTRPLLQQSINQHILLVSDAEDFAIHGGMIQFTLRDNKLKLVVNLNSVKQANLKLSSKLLRMAEILE